MLEFLGVIVTIVAVIGVLLNNNHNKLCFKLWIFSNTLSAGLHLATFYYSLALRDLIFVYLAWQGLRKWSKYQQFFKGKNKWQT